MTHDFGIHISLNECIERFSFFVWFEFISDNSRLYSQYFRLGSEAVAVVVISKSYFQCQCLPDAHVPHDGGGKRKKMNAQSFIIAFHRL